MSTVHVSGKKVTTSNAEEAKSILSNLFPLAVGFVEDEGEVTFAQNMSVQEAKKILNPNFVEEVVKPKAKPKAKPKPKKVVKKTKVEKAKPKKKPAKKNIKAKAKDKKKKKGKK